MADSGQHAPARGDEAELFREFNDELVRLVTSKVRCRTRDVIEDACSFAWAEFLRYQPSRERNWRGWLYRTAQRQAWLLAGEERETLPLSARDTAASAAVAPIDEFELRQDLDEALDLIAKLPLRLRRVAFLRAVGLPHREIGELTGDSPTRVHKLVTRANDRIQEIQAARRRPDPERSPRAERLWQLESAPPQWLVEQIGAPTRLSRRMAGETSRRRAWRRAALALDDYRELAGDEAVKALSSEAPEDRELRAAHTLAVRAVDAWRAEQCRELGPQRR
jgi:RNA polymerase sigma factor (sigma-70 family)